MCIRDSMYFDCHHTQSNTRSIPRLNRCLVHYMNLPTDCMKLNCALLDLRWLTFRPITKGGFSALFSPQWHNYLDKLGLYLLILSNKNLCLRVYTYCLSCNFSTTLFACIGATSFNPLTSNQGASSQSNPSPNVLSGATTYQWHCLLYTSDAADDC